MASQTESARANAGDSPPRKALSILMFDYDNPKTWTSLEGIKSHTNSLGEAFGWMGVDNTKHGKSFQNVKRSVFISEAITFCGGVAPSVFIWNELIRNIEYAMLEIDQIGINCDIKYFGINIFQIHS